MTAVLVEDAVTAPAAPRAAVAPAPKRNPRPPVAGGDPMVDAASRLLSIPLRHLYAVLWRVGLIEVTA
ncbi:Rv1535 family protein [Mycobacterium sp.]|uniref:Rv1535 family protein n=1 Tax=Mycobacterium sp. TaxID=1785 RepID=UPI002BC8F61C|nr:Rv1535 family protein [Mycobacterium sp.]HTY31550.1 Rv1535 family protein [Mycobacterium sp.]